MKYTNNIMIYGCRDLMINNRSYCADAVEKATRKLVAGAEPYTKYGWTLNHTKY
jgi:hypothetical protein